MEETNVEDNKSTNIKKTVKSGITFGSALAMVISYTTWKSVGWAIFHGLLSWVYVIYFLLRYLILVCRTDNKGALLYTVRCSALRAELGSPFGRAVGAAD